MVVTNSSLNCIWIYLIFRLALLHSACYLTVFSVLRVKKRGVCHIVSYCICYVKSAILNTWCIVSWYCDIFSLIPFMHSIIYFSLIWWVTKAVLKSLFFGSYMGYSIFEHSVMPDPGHAKPGKKWIHQSS